MQLLRDGVEEPRPRRPLENERQVRTRVDDGVAPEVGLVGDVRQEAGRRDDRDEHEQHRAERRRQPRTPERRAPEARRNGPGGRSGPGLARRPQDPRARSGGPSQWLYRRYLEALVAQLDEDGSRPDLSLGRLRAAIRTGARIPGDGCISCCRNGRARLASVRGIRDERSRGSGVNGSLMQRA